MLSLEKSRKSKNLPGRLRADIDIDCIPDSDFRRYTLEICVQSENYEKGVRLETVNAFFLLKIDFYSFIIKIPEKKRM